MELNSLLKVSFIAAVVFSAPACKSKSSEETSSAKDIRPGQETWGDELDVGRKLRGLFEKRNPGYGLEIVKLSWEGERWFVVIRRLEDDKIVAQTRIELRRVSQMRSDGQLEAHSDIGVFYKGNDFIGTTESFCQSDNLKKTYYIKKDSGWTVPSKEEKLTMARCDISNQKDGKPSEEEVITNVR